jgi:hypothetical protein
MKQVGLAPPPLSGDPVSQHVQDIIELGPRKILIGIGATAQSKELLFRPGLAGRCCDNLLGQNVERAGGIVI